MSLYLFFSFILHMFLSSSRSRWTATVRTLSLTEDEIKRRKKIFHLFLTKVRNRQCAAGLHKWCDFVQSLRHEERTQRKAAARWKHALVHRSFSSWHDSVLILVRNRNLIARALKRLQHRCLTRCLEQWLALVDDRCCLRHRMLQCLTRWRQVLIDGGFRKWVATNTRQARSHYKLELDEAQSLTFRQKKHYEEAKRHAQLKICVVYYRIRWLRASLRKWREGTSRTKKFAQIKRRAANTFRNLHLARSFSSWRTNTIHEFRRRQSLQQLELSVGLRRQSDRMLRSIINRMRHHLMHRCFSSWRESQLTTKRARAFVLRSRRGTEARCLTKWRAQVTNEMEERSAKRRHMQIVLFNMTRSLVSRGWRAWLRCLEIQRSDFRQREERERVKQRRVRRAIASMRRSNVVLAFRRWCVVVVVPCIVCFFLF